LKVAGYVKVLVCKMEPDTLRFELVDSSPQVVLRVWASAVP
jgi:hypothetical protein